MVHDQAIFESEILGYCVFCQSDFIHSITSKLAMSCDLISSFQFDQSVIEQVQTYCGPAHSF